MLFGNVSSSKTFRQRPSLTVVFLIIFLKISLKYPLIYFPML